MTLPTNFNGGLNIFNSNVPNFLTDDQLNRLSYAFQQWYDDKTISNYRRFLRGRHWLVFLIVPPFIDIYPYVPGVQDC